MTDQTGNQGYVPEIGSRVEITVADSSNAGNVRCTGRVVEDYAELVLDSDAIGRDWAQVHRWAVALDDGRLVFANEGVLVPEE
ncbi:hypothetical protein [Rhodococcus sp. T9N]|uniref:hypothetical protein n=1 Tax=Rhodococcus sp. T9N TaxID=627445 RepID=UPI0021C2BFC2|nr:hypothetical protein [Rhodococcus sp. T9N]